MKTHTKNGRAYTVLASFDGQDAQSKANEYIRTHASAVVLDEVDGLVILADERDRGVELEQDSDFGSNGWTSIVEHKQGGN